MCGDKERCLLMAAFDQRVTCSTDDDCCGNAIKGHCCGGFCSHVDCPPDPIPACTDGGRECWENTNLKECCPANNMCMSETDAKDPEKCNRNPQEHCSADDEGAACLLN